MDYFSGWSTALCMLFAIMYYTDGLMYAKIEDEWQRIAASYAAIWLICGALCHFAGRQFKEGWDPNFSYLKSFKTHIAIFVVWTLSIKYRESDKMNAATVLSLFTVCWFGTHWTKMIRDARLKELQERRQRAKLAQVTGAGAVVNGQAAATVANGNTKAKGTPAKGSGKKQR